MRGRLITPALRTDWAASPSTARPLYDQATSFPAKPTPEPEPVTCEISQSYPLRLQILSILSGATMSAADIARETGTAQANASYHLRRLHEGLTNLRRW